MFSIYGLGVLGYYCCFFFWGGEFLQYSPCNNPFYFQLWDREFYLLIREFCIFALLPYTEKMTLLSQQSVLLI